MPAHNAVANLTKAAALGTTIDPTSMPMVGAAFTQTYSTADRTVAALTAESLVLTATNIASKTASATLTQSAATNPSDANFDQLAKDLGTAINAIIADILAIKKNHNALVDDLQAAKIIAA